MTRFLIPKTNVRLLQEQTFQNIVTLMERVAIRVKIVEQKETITKIMLPLQIRWVVA